MCLYNTLIINRKYTSNKKNGGNIPPIQDPRVKYVPIGCGNCIECRKQKARSWQLRLLEDIKEHKNGKFITLTFSDAAITQLTEKVENKKAEGYQLDNDIATKGVRLFLERWRKHFKKSVRHWFVTELGHQGTENIHIHGIIWTNETFDTIAKHWQYGHIWPTKDHYKANYVSPQTVNYVIKYVSKTDKDHPHYKSIVLTSPGIGRYYTKNIRSKSNTFNGKHTNELYRTSTGHQISMPIYWRNKIYSDHERELLWLQRLDKNERWICGERVDADDEKSYNAILKWHQQRNKRLGYGDATKNWKQEEYENEKRKLLHLTRIKRHKQKQGMLGVSSETLGTLANSLTAFAENSQHTKANYNTPITESKENAILNNYLQRLRR